jgi:hypothetical protein
LILVKITDNLAIVVVVVVVVVVEGLKVMASGLFEVGTVLIGIAISSVREGETSGVDFGFTRQRGIS